MRHRNGSWAASRRRRLLRLWLRLRAALADRRVTRATKVLFRPLASVVMIHRPWVGALIWLAVAQDLRWLALAMLGLFLGEAARITLRVEGKPESETSLKANALLTALAVAWLLPANGVPLAAQLGVVAVSAALAAFLAAAVLHALDGTDLPPLVVGYCVVASVLFLIFPQLALASALAVDWGELPAGFGDWVVVFFRTIGAFFFVPYLGPGMIIAGAILLWSRTMFLAGLVGWTAGILTSVALSHLGVLFYWLPAAYNFFLAGMALGSVYFLPGWAGLGAAAFAGCLAAFTAVGLQHLLNFAAPAFLPIPFTLTVWIGIGALQPVARRGRLMWNAYQALRPEQAWWRTAFESAKWGRQEDLLMVPLAGEVEVTQGFSGRISHVGPWRHALDFQRPASKARRSRGDASIFGAEVLAPAPGIVERVQNGIPDNAMGVSNYAENWGNHVVIRLDAGGWALLAHLRQGSATLPAGARVGFGTVLGRVGNSGRSPVPHLHLQVQKGAEPGEATQPFRLANYLYAEQSGAPLVNWTAAAVPTQGTRLKVAPSNPEVHKLLAGMSPGRALWSVEIEGEVPRDFLPPGDLTSLRIDISLDSAGRQVFATRDGGSMAARFDPDAWRVVELDEPAPPMLRLLALAAPSVPYAAGEGIRWADIAIASPGPAMAGLRQSLSPFRREPFVRLRSICEREPSQSGNALTIETRPAVQSRGLPGRMVCEFRPIEGPSSLIAEFANGSLTYVLCSFVPK